MPLFYCGLKQLKYKCLQFNDLEIRILIVKRELYDPMGKRYYMIYAIAGKDFFKRT